MGECFKVMCLYMNTSYSFKAVCMHVLWMMKWLCATQYVPKSVLHVKVRGPTKVLLSNVSPGCHGNQSFDTPVFLLMTSMIALSLC